MVPFFVLDRDFSQYAGSFKNYDVHSDKPSELRVLFRGSCPSSMLLEKFGRQPRASHFHDFYDTVLSGERAGAVHFFEERTEPSPLAEALTVRYVTGHLYRQSVSLELDVSLLGDVSGELRGGPTLSSAFRDEFLLGRLTRVSDGTYRFRTNPEDVMERVGFSFQMGRHYRLPKCAVFQLDYLKFNPYFVLEVGDTMTFKFVAPFNETFDDVNVNMDVVPYPLRAAVYTSRGLLHGKLPQLSPSKELVCLMTSDSLMARCRRVYNTSRSELMCRSTSGV